MNCSCFSEDMKSANHQTCTKCEEEICNYSENYVLELTTTIPPWSYKYYHERCSSCDQKAHRALRYSKCWKCRRGIDTLVQDYYEDGEKFVFCSVSCASYPSGLGGSRTPDLKQISAPYHRLFTISNPW